MNDITRKSYDEIDSYEFDLGKDSYELGNE